MKLLLDTIPNLTYTPHVQTCITCHTLNPKGLLYTPYGVMCPPCYKVHIMNKQQPIQIKATHKK